jgi:hypothetical protein
MKQEDKPPSKKYFKPADVEDSESLYTVAKRYTAKDCSSILKYIETRSELEINKEPPKVVNSNKREYSDKTGPDLWSSIISSSVLELGLLKSIFNFFELNLGYQGISITAPII